MKLTAAFLLTISLLAAACGNALSPTVEKPGCDDGTAVVRVGDGFLQQICGCDEDDDSIVQAGDPFTCTVSAGETVVFFYRGARRPHRVVSTGANSFPEGPLFNPKSDKSPAIHPVIFDQAGTYEFEDELQPELAGEIVVL